MPKPERKMLERLLAAEIKAAEVLPRDWREYNNIQCHHERRRIKERIRDLHEMHKPSGTPITVVRNQVRQRTAEVVGV